MARVQRSFAAQGLMTHLGANLLRVAPGEVDVLLPVRPELGQQHGFVHAGAVTAVLDSACGYAALSLMPADRAVLAVEFKVNLLAPATGVHLVARGRVRRTGRTITVCQGEAVAVDQAGSERVVALMQATMMAVTGRSDVAPGL